MTVTKNELIELVEQYTDLKRVDATNFIEDFFSVMSKSLEVGNDVKIPGFGNFVLRKKNKRLGRNPKTGEEHVINARTVATFKPSNILKLAVRDLQQETKKPKEK